MHRSRARPFPFSSKPMEIVPKSLGQDFLKDCGYREGKALRLHSKTEIRGAFTAEKAFQFQLSPPGDQKYCLKNSFALQNSKSVLFGSGFQRGALSCRAPLSCGTTPRIVPQFTPRRAHCVLVKSREECAKLQCFKEYARPLKRAPLNFLDRFRKSLAIMREFFDSGR